MYFWCFLWMSSVTTTSYGAARHRCASASVIVCIAIACMGGRGALGSGQVYEAPKRQRVATMWASSHGRLFVMLMQFGYFDFLGRKKTSTSLLMHLKIQLGASKNRHCRFGSFNLGAYLGGAGGTLTSSRLDDVTGDGRSDLKCVRRWSGRSGVLGSG